MAPSRWWRRAPFLPVPSPAYVRFRLETQYGTSPGQDVTSRVARDVLKYLQWVAAWDGEAPGKSARDAHA